MLGVAMESVKILDKMSQRVRRAVDIYEAGEPTIGRKVDMHEEVIGALVTSLADLGGVLAAAESELEKRRLEPLGG